MAYDAGSIEASLTVDRTPFQEGLAQADREAAEFSRKRYAAVIDLDTARADRKARDTRDELDRLGEKTARPKVDIDTARPLAELGLIKAAIEDINRKGVTPGGSGGSSGSGDKNFLQKVAGGPSPSWMVTGITAAIPAAIPIVATLTAGVGALASAFTAAGVGAGGFALLAKPQLEQVAKAQQQLTAAQQQYDKATTNAGRATALRNEYLIYAQLTPQQRTYMDQLTGLKSVYKDLQAAVSPQVFTVAASVIHALGAAGELLKPVFQAAGDTFVELGRQFDSWVTKSAGLRSFVDFLTRQTGPAIYSFAHDLANIARGFGGILMAFEPLLGSVEGGLTSFTAKFAAWGQGLGASAGFQKFLDYVRQNAPIVGHMLAELGRTVMTIITQLAPFGPVGLQLITMLAELINQHPGLVKLAAALILVWKAVSLLSGAAGGIAGVAEGFSKFTKMFAKTSEAAAVEPAVGGITLALKTLGGGSVVAGGLLGGVLAAGTLVAVNAFSHLISGTHEANAAIAQMNTVIARTPLSTGAYGTAIDNMQAKVASLNKQLSGASGFFGWFTGSSESAAAQKDAYQAQLPKTRLAQTVADSQILNLTRMMSTPHPDNPNDPMRVGIVDSTAWDKNLATIRAMAAAGATLKGTFAQNAEDVRAFAAAAGDGAVAQSALVNWFNVSAKAGATAAEKTQAYTDAISAMNGASSSLLSTQDAATKSVNDLGSALAQGSTDFTSTTDAAIQNRGAITNVANAVMQHVAAMNQQKLGSQQVTNYIGFMKAALLGQLQQLGLNTAGVRALVNQLFQMPPSKATNVTVPGAAAANSLIQNLNKGFNNLPDHRTITLNVISNAASQLAAIQSMINNINPNIPITVSGYANLSKLTSQQFNSANGNIFSAFAGGGFENHVAQFAQAGAMRLWAEPETGGEAYIPLAASKRARSMKIWQETGRLLGANTKSNVTQNFSYAGPLTPQVVSEARRQLDFAMGS